MIGSWNGLVRAIWPDDCFWPLPYRIQLVSATLFSILNTPEKLQRRKNSKFRETLKGPLIEKLIMSNVLIFFFFFFK